MMHVDVLAVGKLKERFLTDGCAEYLKRLAPYAKVTVTEIKEERCPDAPSPAEIERVLAREGERILSKIAPQAFVVPLCIEGRQMDSVSFSETIGTVAQTGGKLTFVIGGSFGLSPAVKARGDLLFSFGKMTLPHQLARLVLLEQVYRAFQILNGGKYHK